MATLTLAVVALCLAAAVSGVAGVNQITWAVSWISAGALALNSSY